MLPDRKTLLIFFVIVLFITGCAATSKTGGVYHIVKRGETLWRIARAYNTDPDAIARANNLPDTTIEAGSALFIPNATKPVDITPGTAPEGETTGTKSTHTVQEETLEPARTAQPLDSATTEPPISQQISRPRFTWPVEGTVSSKFGTYQGMRHNGIKIDAAEGTPVLAAADGTITYAAPMKYFGETIIIKHNDTYSTVYSQLKERVVRTGATVKQGDQIGLLGKGEDGNPHLYFEVRRKNRAKNPLYYLPQKK
ncbi:MAG: M23 family metallopeptidase [Deltaproteobacteria bacterium]|nr:M23 family metallopeptidase [Deltaproteobacteria bacterium]